MPNTELLSHMEGLLQRPRLEPEARLLIELALKAQKSGALPDLRQIGLITSVVHVDGEAVDGQS